MLGCGGGGCNREAHLCAEPGYSKIDVTAAFRDLAKDADAISDARLHQWFAAAGCAWILVAALRCADALRSFNNDAVESYLREHMPVAEGADREYAAFVEQLFTR